MPEEGEDVSIDVGTGEMGWFTYEDFWRLCDAMDVRHGRTLFAEGLRKLLVELSQLRKQVVVSAPPLFTESQES